MTKATFRLTADQHAFLKTEAERLTDRTGDYVSANAVLRRMIQSAMEREEMVRANAAVGKA